MGGLWSRVGRGIHNRPIIDEVYMAMSGHATTTAIAYPYAKLIPVGILADDRIHKLPGFGMSRKGDQPHQPPAALHSPAFGGNYFGPQQRPLNPTSVQSVQHLYTPGDNIVNTPQNHNVK